jgi:hypothetical protein
VSGGGDSAGVPWRGRTFQPSGFEGDEGTADPRLAAALAAYRDTADALVHVVHALSGARLLVPVVATVGPQEASERTGRGADQGAGTGAETPAEMAVVTLRGRDGRVALPVFSSVDALAAWDPAARPVPVGAGRAALAAVEEAAQVLVLDVAGPVTAVVPRPAVWAVAQGRTWTPSPEDPQVVSAVAAAAGAEPLVEDVTCTPGTRAELCVVLAVRPGLDRAGLDAVTAAVSRRLAADPLVAERVDSVEMRVTSA